MGPRKKEAQERQKKHFERRLGERLQILSKKGIEGPVIDKDTLIKKLRASIRAINNRLRVMASNEKRTEELARLKAEKVAPPPPPVEAERKGKAAKETPEGVKEKKRKKEKEKGQEQEKKQGTKEEKKEEKEQKETKKKAKE